jgi:D-glycero-D-manno-heptose 1,7-bisphosphate phosphatase
VTIEGTRCLGTAFLDRDGTINRKAATNDYVKSAKEFVLLPDVVQAIRSLNEARFRVIVVTNQRGIARGRMTEESLRSIHAYMLEQLAAGGATIDAIYYCPHDEGSCTCRKPEVGMFLRAAEEHPDVSFARSAMFGDSDADMDAGTTLGMVCVRIGSGGMREADDCGDVDLVEHRAPTLLEGVRWLLSQRVTSQESSLGIGA